MNRTRLLLIALCCIFAACEAPGPIGPKSCEPYSGPDPDCHNDKSQENTRSNPRVTIHTKSLMVTPACVRARHGSVIKVRLTPVADNKLGSAQIIPKAGNVWPAGSNDIDKDEISIPVTAAVPLGYQSYSFVVNGVCVDPRVHVEH